MGYSLKLRVEDATMMYPGYDVVNAGGVHSQFDSHSSACCDFCSAQASSTAAVLNPARQCFSLTAVTADPHDSLFVRADRDAVIPDAASCPGGPPAAQCCMHANSDVSHIGVLRQAGVSDAGECCNFCAAVPNCTAAVFDSAQCYAVAADETEPSASLYPSTGKTAVLPGPCPPTTAQPSQCCQLDGFRIGNDGNFAQPTLASADACCTFCSSLSNCTAAVFEGSTQTCFAVLPMNGDPFGHLEPWAGDVAIIPLIIPHTPCPATTPQPSTARATAATTGDPYCGLAGFSLNETGTFILTSQTVGGPDECALLCEQTATCSAARLEPASLTCFMYPMNAPFDALIGGAPEAMAIVLGAECPASWQPCWLSYQGYEINGQDISTTTAQDFPDCQAQCMATPSCSGLSFQPASTCLLKLGTVFELYRNIRTSGSHGSSIYHPGCPSSVNSSLPTTVAAPAVGPYCFIAHWNQSYQTTNLAVFPGPLTAQECADHCATNASCVAFTLRQSNDECLLKGSMPPLQSAMGLYHAFEMKFGADCSATSVAAETIVIVPTTTEAPTTETTTMPLWAEWDSGCLTVHRGLQYPNESLGVPLSSIQWDECAAICGNTTLCVGAVMDLLDDSGLVHCQLKAALDMNRAEPSTDNWFILEKEGYPGGGPCPQVEAYPPDEIWVPFDAGCCELLPNVEVEGGWNLYNVHDKTWAECCEVCALEPNCTAVTIHDNEYDNFGDCHLRSAPDPALNPKIPSFDRGRFIIIMAPACTSYAPPTDGIITTEADTTAQAEPWTTSAAGAATVSWPSYDTGCCSAHFTTKLDGFDLGSTGPQMSWAECAAMCEATTACTAALISDAHMAGHASCQMKSKVDPLVSADRNANSTFVLLVKTPNCSANTSFVPDVAFQNYDTGCCNLVPNSDIPGFGVAGQQSNAAWSTCCSACASDANCTAVVVADDSVDGLGTCYPKGHPEPLAAVETLTDTSLGRFLLVPGPCSTPSSPTDISSTDLVLTEITTTGPVVTPEPPPPGTCYEVLADRGSGTSDNIIQQSNWNVSQCAEACEAEPACIAFTHEGGLSKCELQSNIEEGGTANIGVNLYVRCGNRSTVPPAAVTELTTTAEPEPTLPTCMQQYNRTNIRDPKLADFASITAHNCQMECLQHPDCVAVMYKSAEERCWLYSGDGGLENNNHGDFVVYILDCGVTLGPRVTGAGGGQTTTAPLPCLQPFTGRRLEQPNVGEQSSVSLQGCFAFCKGTVGCVAVTFRDNTQTCWLFESALLEPSFDGSFDTYILECNVSFIPRPTQVASTVSAAVTEGAETTTVDAKTSTEDSPSQRLSTTDLSITNSTPPTSTTTEQILETTSPAFVRSTSGPNPTSTPLPTKMSDISTSLSTTTSLPQSSSGHGEVSSTELSTTHSVSRTSSDGVTTGQSSTKTSTSTVADPTTTALHSSTAESGTTTPVKATTPAPPSSTTKTSTTKAISTETSSATKSADESSTAGVTTGVEQSTTVADRASTTIDDSITTTTELAEQGTTTELEEEGTTTQGLTSTLEYASSKQYFSEARTSTPAESTSEGSGSENERSSTASMMTSSSDPAFTSTATLPETTILKEVTTTNIAASSSLPSINSAMEYSPPSSTNEFAQTSADDATIKKTVTTSTGLNSELELSTTPADVPEPTEKSTGEITSRQTTELDNKTTSADVQSTAGIEPPSVTSTEAGIVATVTKKASTEQSIKEQTTHLPEMPSTTSTRTITKRPTNRPTKKPTKNPTEKPTQKLEDSTTPKAAKAMDEQGIDGLTATLGLDDLPEDVVKALENGDPDPLLDHLNEQDVFPSDEEIHKLKDSSLVPDEISNAVEEWRKDQVSPDTKQELVKLVGEQVPKSVIDGMEEGRTAKPLTDWLEKESKGLTPEEVAELQGKLQPALVEELDDWATASLADDIEEGLGVGDLPEEVIQALADGDSESLLKHLNEIDAYPTDEAIASLKESPFVADDVAEDLEEWKTSQVPPATKAELDSLAGTTIPKSVIDALEKNGSADPLTDWLEDNGLGFPVGDLSPLEASLKPEVFDSLRDWAAEKLVEDVEKALEPTELPTNVQKSLKEGDLEPLKEHLNNQEIIPSDDTIAALEDSPFVTQDIADELVQWKEVQITPEEKEKLDKVVGKTIPKPAIDEMEANNSADPLTEWLDDQDIELDQSELSPLEGVLRPELLAQLKAWAVEPKLEPVGLTELEKMLGHSIPQPVQDEVQKGNYAPLRKWLDDEEIATSKPEFARLEAGRKQWDVPQSLMDELRDWYETALLRGAVKALDDFAGTDVPKEILDAIEAGRTKELTEFLDKEDIQPSQQAYERLAKQAPSVRLPDDLVDALAAWYEARGVVFTSTEAPSTPAPPPRTLAPGETTTPPFPLSETEALVTDTLQTLGCAALLGIVAGTVVLYGAVVRDPSVERFLHLNQELALFLGHVLVISMRARTEHHIPCKLASMGLQFFFLADFAFLLFEALQAFAIATNVVPRHGLFTKPQFFVMGWAGAGVWTGVSGMLTHQHYVSAWSCWLNIGHGTAMSTFAPVALMSGAAIILVEAAGMGDHEATPDTSMEQRTASIANQKGLLLTVPLNIGSWFVGLFAVYSANVALYGVVFGLNLALAIAIFAFHTLGNPKVLQMVKACFGKA